MIRRGDRVDLDSLESLWKSLHQHHATVLPELDGARPRSQHESWAMRREKYTRWLDDPATFILLAEESEVPIGYAFVTIGSAYACWATGRVAESRRSPYFPSGATPASAPISSTQSGLSSRNATSPT